MRAPRDFGRIGQHCAYVDVERKYVTALLFSIYIYIFFLEVQE